MWIKTVFYFAVIGLTLVTAQYQMDFDLNQLKQLDPNMQQTVNEDQLRSLQNKSSQAFREQCLKNGGPDAYNKSRDAWHVFSGCIQGLINQQVLMKEIEEAKPNGRIDEVFKKYCTKSPQFKSCFAEMFESSKPCFSEGEQIHLKTMQNITEKLMEFVCFKDGDRIALFISEDGPECLDKNHVAIQQCVNSTLGKDINYSPNDLSILNIPTVNFDNKTCGQLYTLQKCVVRILETCPQPTTANIAEALFKFVRQATPCAKIPEEYEVKQKEPMHHDHKASTPEEVKSANGVTTLTVATATILATGLVARLF